MSKKNENSDAQKALDALGFKLEDALKYASKYKASFPGIEKNTELCVRMYLRSKGYSLDDVLTGGFGKVSTLVSNNIGETVVIVSDESKPFSMSVCESCKKSMRGYQPGEQAICSSKRCNGTMRTVVSRKYLTFWAGDDSGTLQLIIPEDVLSNTKLLHKTITVRGWFTNTDVPKMWVYDVSEKEPVSESLEASAPPGAPESDAPDEDSIARDKQDIDEAKMAQVLAKVEKVLRIHGNEMTKPLFEEWLNNYFPGIPLNIVLMSLKSIVITKDDNGNEVVQFVSPEPNTKAMGGREE